MKNWTRTSLIFLAFSIGACESQAPTAPTSLGPAAVGVSSGSVASGTSASGALGVRRGGKRKDDKPVFEVDAVLAWPCTALNASNSWVSTSPGLTGDGSLSPRWAQGDLTVTTVAPGGGVFLTGRASVNVILGKDKVALYMDTNIGLPNRVRYNTDALPISIVGDTSSGTFAIQVRADPVNVYPLTARGNKQGPSVGTICVGDLVYTKL